MKKFDLNENAKIYGSSILGPEVFHTLLQAEDIIKKAHNDAQKIIEQAHIEKQKIIEQGHKEASDSLQQVHEDLKKKFEDAKNEVINKMYREMEEFLKKFRSGIPYLVENILFRIIGEFDESELIARSIAMGIEEMRDAYEMVVRINPQEYTNLQKLLTPWLRQSGDGFIRLETDNFVPKGEAIIITEIGTVEISLSKQLDSYLEALKSQFGIPNIVKQTNYENDSDDNDFNDEDIDAAIESLNEDDDDE